MREFNMKVKGLEVPVPIQQASDIKEALASGQFASEDALLQSAHRARRIEASNKARDMAAEGKTVKEIAAYVNALKVGDTTRAPAGTGGRVKAADRAKGQEALAKALPFDVVVAMPAEQVQALVAAQMLPTSYIPRLREAGKLPKEEAVAPAAEAPAAPAASKTKK